MSIVGLTKLRYPSNGIISPLRLSPPISTRTLYRSYCASTSFASVGQSPSNANPTPQPPPKRTKSHNPGVAKMMEDRLRDLEEGLLLRSNPINATKIMFEPKMEDGPYTKQTHYETKSLDRSVRSYRRMYEDVIKIGRGAALGASYKYLISWLDPLAKSIEATQFKWATAIINATKTDYNLLADSLEAEALAESNTSATSNSDVAQTDDTTENTTETDTVDTSTTDDTEEKTSDSEASLTEEERLKIAETLEGLPPYMSELAAMTAHKLAVITMHTCLSYLMQNNGSMPFNRISFLVGNAVQAEYVLQKVKEEDKKFFKTLKKKLGGNLNVNKLNKYAKSWTNSKWDNKTMTQLGAELINHLIQLAVADDPYKRRVNVFERTSKVGRQDPQLKMHQFILNQVLKDPDVLKEMVSAIYLPMIVPPKPWQAPVNGGYLNVRTTLMRVKDWKTQMGTVIQLWRTRNDMDQLFLALDSLGKTSWKVNKEVYDVIQAAWDNGGDIADMPNRYDKEIPTSAPASMTQRDYWKLIKKIKLHNNNMNSLRCDLKLKLAVARDFQDEKLYFPHNLDFRGRSYPIPAHLNHMGPDICRSLLMFYEGKRLGAEGWRWLKIHTANLFGKDKLSFDERVQFVEGEIPNILDSANNPLGGRRWWLQAEHPWQCLGACFEIKKALALKNPEDYVCHLPVHQDGTCNGLQHYAALGGDVMGAQQVNLLPSDRPQDVYAGVAKLVSKRLEEDAAAGNQLAQSLLGKISRKIVKQTVMTSVYGVTYIGARAQIANAIKDQPNMQEFYSDDSKLFLASSYITKHTFASLKEMFLGARLIMDWLNQCARVISKTGVPVMWMSPIQVPVVQPYRKEANKDYVKTVVLEMRLRETHDLPINVTRQRTAFPPNLIHSIDSSHMMFTALECDKAGIAFAAVHDSYWTHAADVAVMNKILREEFIKLHKQPLLEQIQDRFAVEYPAIPASDYPIRPKRGNFDLDQVANSQYFFN